MRRDREDYAAQEARVVEAREGLVAALVDLSKVATDAARVAGRRKNNRTPTREITDPVVAAFRRVEEAEWVLDVAEVDLATAQGEHL